MKEKSYKTLKNTLDRIFAQFIKARDCKDGYFTCMACGKIKPEDQFNASHYHSRRYLSLRWSEKNVGGCCIHCNKYLAGNIPAYTTGLVLKYGKGIIQQLEIQKMNLYKYSRFELQVLIDFYKNELKKHE